MEHIVAGFAHRCVGLDRENLVPVFQKKPCERSRTRGDIRNCVLWTRGRIRGLQKLDNLRRISRTITDIILHSIGKSCSWRRAHDILV